MIRPAFKLNLDGIPGDFWGCFGWVVGSILVLVINAAVIYGIVKLVRWAWGS